MSDRIAPTWVHPWVTSVRLPRELFFLFVDFWRKSSSCRHWRHASLPRPMTGGEVHRHLPSKPSREPSRNSRSLRITQCTCGQVLGHELQWRKLLRAACILPGRRRTVGQGEMGSARRNQRSRMVFALFRQRASRSTSLPLAKSRSR